MSTMNSIEHQELTVGDLYNCWYAYSFRFSHYAPLQYNALSEVHALLVELSNKYGINLSCKSAMQRKIDSVDGSRVREMIACRRDELNKLAV